MLVFHLQVHCGFPGKGSAGYLFLLPYARGVPFVAVIPNITELIDGTCGLPTGRLVFALLAPTSAHLPITTLSGAP